MLNAYIIEKLRKEREARHEYRRPLRIRVPGDYGMEHAPAPQARKPETEQPEEIDWGAVVVDFTI